MSHPRFHRPPTAAIQLETYDVKTGWAIFASKKDQDPELLAFCPDRADAERITRALAGAGYGDLGLVPAVFYDEELIAANDVRFKEGVEALISRTGLSGVWAEEFRKDAAAPGSV